MSLRTGRLPPQSNKARQQFRVNRPGLEEGVWQPLYDFQTYALAGTTTEYIYFQVPQGQAGKTYADTNMQSAGQLPYPIKQLVTRIQVVVFPGSAVNATGAIATSGLNWDDVYTLAKAGYVRFHIGSKDMLIDAPLGKFTTMFRLAGAAALADATTAAADLHSQIDYAVFAGEPYDLDPKWLEPNQNFSVSLHFPTTTAINANARVGVILDGFQYRLSQ
jgi:hypothetical protein